MEGESALEAYLRTAPPEYERPLPGGGGHHEKKILILRGGVAVAAKPGHTDEYRQQAACEVAAYRLAAAMGLERLVPTTVMRSIPGPGGAEFMGSAQVMWPQFVVALAGGFSCPQCPDDLAWRIAVFDGLAANTDRHDQNWGAITALPDAVLIDHGHCFKRGRVTSPFWTTREGHPIPEDVLQHVEMFLGTSNTTRMREVLDDVLVDEVVARAQHLVEEGHLTLP